MTDLEAANKALVLLGVAPVDSLTRDVQAARVMNQLFETTRLTVITEFPWSFSLRLQPLEPAPAGTAVPEGWLFAWEYPASAALFRVFSPALKREAKIDHVTANGFVFTKRADAWGEFVDVSAPVSEWPEMAAEAFVVRLAANAAPMLAGSPQLGASLLQQYGTLSALAEGGSTNNERLPQVRATHYLDVRCSL